MSKKWYVIHVFSGSEKKVSQSIEEQVISKNMQDLIEEVLRWSVRKVEYYHCLDFTTRVALRSTGLLGQL